MAKEPFEDFVDEHNACEESCEIMGPEPVQLPLYEDSFSLCGGHSPNAGRTMP